jgi:hypothetical protein
LTALHPKETKDVTEDLWIKLSISLKLMELLLKITILIKEEMELVTLALNPNKLSKSPVIMMFLLTTPPKWFKP